MNIKQALQLHLKQLLFATFTYFAVLSASVSLLRNLETPKVWQVIISLVPAVPVVFIVIILMSMLKDGDELQQRIHLYSITFSAALTGLLTFSYGLLENIGLPKLPTFAILPMLFVLWGVGFGYFTARHE
jgi:hypothetical protein